VKDESSNHVSALTGRIMSDTESCEEEMTYDELDISYYDLIAKNTELTQMVEEQVKEIAQLQDERFDNLAHISELNDELSKLNSQLKHMKERVGMMTADSMFKHLKEHQTKKKPNSWVCDHCESKQFQQKPYKKRWTPKSINTGLIAHTSLKASSKEDWYFNSGCSRHMTGVDKYIEDVRPYATNYVTFGDGVKGKIVGIGNLIKHGLPRLDIVLLVKGLTSNLISISQLCDLELHVNFTKPGCQISDEK